MELQKRLKGWDFAMESRFHKGRVKNKLLALSALQNGKTPEEVAEIFQVSRVSLYLWARKVNEEGIEALKDRPRPGNNRRVPKEVLIKLPEEVEKLQKERKGGRVIGKDVVELLKEKFGIEIHSDSIYRVLKRANLVWITARSRHPLAKPEMQEEFKKNSRA